MGNGFAVLLKKEQRAVCERNNQRIERDGLEKEEEYKTFFDKKRRDASGRHAAGGGVCARLLRWQRHLRQMPGTVHKSCPGTDGGGETFFQ